MDVYPNAAREGGWRDPRIISRNRLAAATDAIGGQHNVGRAQLSS